MQNDDDLYKCRVCGFRHSYMPWGPKGRTPTYDICDCCGAEFGYEDFTYESIRGHLERWKRGEATMATVTYKDWLAKKEQEGKGDDTNT